MERYRAELNARRRKRGESAQSVYQDIKRLMALGFRGRSSEMYEVLSRDAFLSALNDPALRIRVLDQHPKTLDDTLSIVVRMESYSGDNHVDSCDNIVDRKRVRVVSPARESETDKRVRKLEELLERQNQKIERLKGQANNTSWNLGDPSQTSPLVAAPQQVATAVPGPPQQRVPASGVQRGRGSGRRQQYNYRLPRDVCSRCMQRGHWRAQCTSPGYRLGGSGHGGPQRVSPVVDNGNVQYGGPYYGSPTYNMPPGSEYGGLRYDSPNVGSYGVPPSPNTAVRAMYRRTTSLVVVVIVSLVAWAPDQLSQVVAMCI